MLIYDLETSKPCCRNINNIAHGTKLHATDSFRQQTQRTFVDVSLSSARVYTRSRFFEYGFATADFPQAYADSNREASAGGQLTSLLRSNVSAQKSALGASSLCNTIQDKGIEYEQVKYELSLE